MPESRCCPAYIGHTSPTGYSKVARSLAGGELVNIHLFSCGLHQQCAPARPLIHHRQRNPHPDLGSLYRDHFAWHLHGEYNALAASRFAEELGELILRADALTYHRPDGHIQGPRHDCYHYQLPGVPDWWTKVLYNVWRAKLGMDG